MKFSSISILVIMIIMTTVMWQLNWRQNKWKEILECDGKGYYAYLPSVFIYNDYHCTFIDEMDGKKYAVPNRFYDYRALLNNKTLINKFYCGTALAQLPFFFIAHAGCYFLGYDMDGYSKPYPIMISIAALFYLLAGLSFLNYTLSLYFISETNKSIVLLASVFGTHLFYYTVGEPSLSHVFSFAFISCFVFFAKKLFNQFERKYFLVLSLLLAFIVLIRPVNGLIIFALPFLAGSKTTFIQSVKKILQSKLYLFGGIVLILSLLSLQFIYYKIATGSFFIYPYRQEGFNFLNPHFIDILFSYKKGLFLYTPMFLLAFVFGFYFWKTNKYEFVSIYGFMFLLIYVLSSWWMWYYGGSFSSRVFVEFIPLFMILLAYGIEKTVNKKLKILSFTSIFLLILVCQIQTYQYRYSYIHWDSMTKEMYWSVFLRLDWLL